jgi:hypothetical protein
MRSWRLAWSSMLTTIRRRTHEPSAAEPRIRLAGPERVDRGKTTPLAGFPGSSDSIADEDFKRSVALKGDERFVATGFVDSTGRSTEIPGAFLQVSSYERDNAEAAAKTDGITIHGNPFRDEPHPVVVSAVKRFGLVGLMACALFAGARRWCASLTSRRRN